jgi:hypothetical protein
MSAAIKLDGIASERFNVAFDAARAGRAERRGKIDAKTIQQKVGRIVCAT